MPLNRVQKGEIKLHGSGFCDELSPVGVITVLVRFEVLKILS